MRKCLEMLANSWLAADNVFGRQLQPIRFLFLFDLNIEVTLDSFLWIVGLFIGSIHTFQSWNLAM